MSESPDSEIVIVRSSRASRAVTGSFLVVCGVWLGWFAITDDPRLALFVAPCVVAFLEVVRGQVRIEPARRTVSSTRAVRTWTGTFAEVAGVSVRRRGPIMLEMVDGSRRWGELRRGFVTTAVMPQPIGSRGQACRIAEMLGVEVSSRRRHMGPGPGNPHLADLPGWPTSASSKVVAALAMLCLLVVLGLVIYAVQAGLL